MPGPQGSEARVGRKPLQERNLKACERWPDAVAAAADFSANSTECNARSTSPSVCDLVIVQ